MGVVLLNWNSADLTTDCLRSLLTGKVIPGDTVVVDNGSSDGSVARIRSEYPSVTVLQNDQNRGFAEANNIGIRYLLSKGVNWIWVLNNDTIVDSACLEHLLEEADDQQRPMILGARIHYYDHPEVIWYAGGAIAAATLQARHITDARLGIERTVPVEFVTGCSMFGNRAAFERFLFDPRYFAYCEDVELCLRFRKGGGTLLYVPRAVIRHRIAATAKKMSSGSQAGRVSSIQHYYLSRNQILLIRQHAASPLNWMVAMAVHLGRVLSFSAGHLLFGRRAKALSVWRGIRDGFSIRL